jgi:hypothetical protein
MKVTDRYQINARNWVCVILDPSPLVPPKVGSKLRAADGREWTVCGVETYAILNPPPPYGIATGHDGPEVGDEVELRVRYRYDVLAAINAGVSEYADPEAMVRQSAPDAEDFKALGEYLRTFWAAPIANLPSYIFECWTRPVLGPGVCEACNGDGKGAPARGRPTRCGVCGGTGNAPVEPAEPGQTLCPKKIEQCGGACIRRIDHDGLCLCAGDADNVPGSCPA